MDTVVKFQPIQTQHQSVAANQIALSRQGAPSCYCDPELTRHAHIHTDMNALMQGEWLLTNAGEAACLHGNMNSHTHSTYFCHCTDLFLPQPEA